MTMLRGPGLLRAISDTEFIPTSIWRFPSLPPLQTSKGSEERGDENGPSLKEII
jgi:hypothetical protein